MFCHHCKEPNPENWFTCRECGNRATPPKWTPSVVIRDNGPWSSAFRKDQIDVKQISQDDYINQVKKDRVAKYG
jgi:RNA polymerase subunit RPABC4/transcription elongation factor Spt4